jgi:hypothetical protein
VCALCARHTHARHLRGMLAEHRLFLAVRLGLAITKELVKQGAEVVVVGRCMFI